MSKSEKEENEAFEKIFLEYFSKIKLFSLKILKSETEAEDITQDIFFKLWAQRDQLKDIQSIESYLYRMTRNLIYNHIKHKYVERDYIAYILSNETPSSDAYEDIYANELRVRVQDAISKMPPQRKKIFLLSRQDGLSNFDIAQQLGLTKSTVDNHIYLAVTGLKRQIIVLFALFFNFVLGNS